jgi:dGTPase
MSGPANRPSERTQAWAATMAGHAAGAGFVLAHADEGARLAAYPTVGREHREEIERAVLRPGATLARGAGDRAAAEPADPPRTCFERDRDRILHSAAFRRLAGKTQVFVFPADHQRTRLTHALEVAQVATGIGRAAGLNAGLTDAIAIGHDCGHGPGGHASEEAFDAFLPEGYDHAVWGADVVLVPLNLCAQTLDGIRNHSWARPTPMTPEGEVVSWADRIAYCAHDFEDAVQAGIVSAADLPAEVAEVCGRSRREQLGTFIGAVVRCIEDEGVVGMAAEPAAALAALRRFNYERIYSRPESVAQSDAVVAVLRALVEHFAARPAELPAEHRPSEREPDPVRTAVAYVAGMTDRFAFDTAARELGWPAERLPRGIDVGVAQ